MQKSTTSRLLLAAAVAVLMMTSQSAPTASVVDQSAQSATAAQEVEAATRSLVDAYVANDHKKYFGAMTDDTSIWAGGRKDRVTRKSYSDMWVPLIEKGGGVAKGGMQDLRVQMSPAGDAGIATFYMPITYKPAPSGSAAGSPNRPRDVNFNITHVWFKKNGRWELVHYYWSTWEAAQPPTQQRQ
jgi:ketosteroid isomerase-like protein